MLSTCSEANTSTGTAVSAAARALTRVPTVTTTSTTCCDASAPPASCACAAPQANAHQRKQPDAKQAAGTRVPNSQSANAYSNGHASIEAVSARGPWVKTALYQGQWRLFRTRGFPYPVIETTQGRIAVGATYVNVTVRNPAERHRTWTGEFLVDTGAWDSVVPRSHLEAIGLSPRGSREYSLADGSPRRFRTDGRRDCIRGRDCRRDGPLR